jgi:hypothetical protein
MMVNIGSMDQFKAKKYRKCHELHGKIDGFLKRHSIDSSLNQYQPSLTTITVTTINLMGFNMI